MCGTRPVVSIRCIGSIASHPFAQNAKGMGHPFVQNGKERSKALGTRREVTLSTSFLDRSVVLFPLPPFAKCAKNEAPEVSNWDKEVKTMKGRPPASII